VFTLVNLLCEDGENEAVCSKFAADYAFLHQLATALTDADTTEAGAHMATAAAVTLGRVCRFSRPAKAHVCAMRPVLTTLLRMIHTPECVEGQFAALGTLVHLATEQCNATALCGLSELTTVPAQVALMLDRLQADFASAAQTLAAQPTNDELRRETLSMVTARRRLLEVHCIFVRMATPVDAL
jgi:hypothetical protein